MHFWSRATATNNVKTRNVLFLGICGALILCLADCQTLNCDKRVVPLNDGCVVFTFDDGPNPDGETTARLLDVLKSYEIQGMFALLGENAEHSPELVRRIRDEGHIIINHGYGDHFAVDLNPREYGDNLRQGEAAIASALGEERLEPRYYRPQGGFYKWWQKSVWRSQGYVMVTATARPYDAVCSQRDRESVARRVVRKIQKQNGGIILLHDGRDSYRKVEKFRGKKPNFDRSWIPETVEEIVIALQEQGFRVGGFQVPEVLDLAAL